MRRNFLTEEDLRHFTRNGARVRGGVDGRHTTEQSGAVSRLRVTKPDAGSIPAPAPSRRYEYQGQIYKSKTEVRYAQYLDALKFGGEITSWQYEPVNFRLPGQKNFYKADWLVCDRHGLTFYDTKGWNQSDARSLVKIKTAAGLNRWATFKQVRWINGEWIERRIEG